MIELGIAAGPAREVRSYTDQVIKGLLAAATGTGTLGPLQTGALETAAGVWQRALVAAEVEGDPYLVEALDAPIRGHLGRELARRGDVVLYLDATAAGPRLVPLQSWTVQGGYQPAEWTYEVTLAGPTRTTTRRVGADSVVHVRYAVDGMRPWSGISPMQHASETGRLAGLLERALADEAGAPVGSIIPQPEGAREPDGLATTITGLRGKVLLTETLAAGSGDRGGRPDADWKQRRIGADPPATLNTIRTAVEHCVLACFGVHPSIAAGVGDGTLARESWRRFQAGTVEPLARLVEGEVAQKLGPCRLTFASLRARDVAGNARAWRSLVGGGPNAPAMDPEEARRLAGLE